jgi:hypothetical protein
MSEIFRKRIAHVAGGAIITDAALELKRPPPVARSLITLENVR